MKLTNSMTGIDTKKANTPLVRLCFQDVTKAQASIARLVRARQKNKISDLDFKALLYGFNIWLGFDKHKKEMELEKRLEALEARYGEGKNEKVF